ncbi:DUF4105 domain-containing protein [Pelagicoccus sp. SDUM812005]|uniref:Lnb N-terminal periplasmic domain-containing protein n=1 Tax=Pelagicoccus sp. SDUM812005 TaxID=3041257 RepID=UPI00280D02AE|nr:DUF4105 domain-containing protein [Pelagicoccus sp. SDUM812005]MDQ8181269.1 DUF4105 domain-containing protein [Pelagicoccus sp. SDUM812005]
MSFVLPFCAFGEEDESLYLYFLERAEEARLHEEPTWRRLLHFRDGRKRSEVNTPEFFLSSKGRSDPKEELKATLSAYFEQGDSGKEESARCRFPARYYWLHSRLELPGYEVAPSDCDRLKRWKLLEETDSVSMYWVSGYFGNPASSFGHALLRLNSRKAERNRSHLLDLTVNFGALVPESEPMLLYILKGLGGGYQAGFSDQYYFTQDQVYSRTEFRDIWDYELNLSERQRTLLVLHLWEIIGKKYTYYFAKENCAYRLATLLELVLNEPMVDRRPWYVPVDLFNRLERIDQGRRDSGLPGIVDTITPIPSSRRVLYSEFSRLSPEALTLANELILAGPNLKFERIRTLDTGDQIDLLDALLAYYNYKELSQIKNPDPELQKVKQEILVQRLVRPARAKTPIETRLESPPTSSTPPLFLSLGIAQAESGSTYATLSFSPFSQESIAYNATLGSDMTVLRATLAGDEGEVFLDRIDFIDVRKLALEKAPVAGENSFSWKAKLGARRSLERKKYPNEWYANVGFGKSWLLSKDQALSGFSSIVASTDGDPLRFRPEIQWTGRVGMVGYDLSAGTEVGESERFDFVWGANIQVNLERRKAVRLQLDSGEANRSSLSFVWSW